MNPWFLRFPGFRQKAVCLSYDDGVRSDRKLIALLDGTELRSAFHLNAGCFGGVTPGGGHPRLTAAEAVSLYADTPHEIAAHSFTHPFLEQLPEGGAAMELLRDRETLEPLFSRMVRGFSYPMGTYNAAVVETVRRCGFAYGRTTADTHGFSLPEEPLTLRPTCRHRDPALPQLCREFLDRDPKWSNLLFFLWGHSYEFEESGNWEVMERFCREMGNRREFWYATPIMLCDYLAAGRRLRASADGTLVENPTATALYLDTAAGKLRLEPGGALRLGGAFPSGSRTPETGADIL